MGKYSQGLKNVGLYSFIGLLVMGGLALASPKTADASITYDPLTDTALLSPNVPNVNSFECAYATRVASTTSFSGYSDAVFDAAYPTLQIGHTPSSGSSATLDAQYLDSPQYWLVKYRYLDLYCSDSNLPADYGEVYYYIRGADVYAESTTTTTRFISVVPSYGSNVATGTVTITVTGYITPEDLANSGGTIQFTSVAHQLSPSVRNNEAITTTAINTSGLFTVTGTSTIGFASIWNEAFVLSTESYQQTWWQQFLSKEVSIFGYSPFSRTDTTKVFVSTSTYFAVGTLSSRQQAEFDQVKLARAYAATTTPYDLSDCSPVATSTNIIGLGYNPSFSVFRCIQNLVIPSGEGWKEIKDNATAGFLAAAPWGYGARLLYFMNAGTSTDATTTLPLISYTFPDTFPVFGGMNLHFDLYPYMVQAADLMENTFVSSTDGQNIWQIFSPIVYLFIGLYLLLKILEDITGLDFSTDATQDHKVGGKVPDETYRYKEKLYQMSRRKNR